jgi:sigma-B regulation protein RsbU (phosphoserine phosphatase)
MPSHTGRPFDPIERAIGLLAIARTIAVEPGAYAPDLGAEALAMAGGGTVRESTGSDGLVRTAGAPPAALTSAPLSTPPAPNAHTMHCMEVWGGNAAVDNGVIMPGLDAWVYARPHGDGAGGGDVHYVSSCATGRITRLLVADVAGHGESVSAVGLNLRTLMRKYVNYLDQSRFVAQLNREFNNIAQAGGFATAVAATYWAPTSVLLACNAGHPRPLWYRARKRAWRFLEPLDASEAEPDQNLRNLPLGIVEPTSFMQFGVRLGKGDLVVFYTDSLIEAPGPDGRQLGEQGLLDLVRSLDPTDPPAMRADLFARLDGWRGGRDPADDVTVLIFRHNGTKPRMSLMDRVRANGRFLRLIGRRLVRGRHDPIPWPEFGLATWGGAMVGRFNERWGGKEH